MASDGVYRLVGVIMLLIFVLGLILNLIIIIIFRTIYKESPTCTNMLILSISYCNLLHIVTYPLNIIASFQRIWDFGAVACRVDAFFVHWMSITSMAHLTMLSVDRYVKVVGKPITNEVRYKILVLVGCWSYGLLWALLPLFGWSSYGLEGVGISCSIQFGSPRMLDVAYELTLFVTDFLLPLGVIIFCQLAVVRKLRIHNAELNDGTDEGEDFAAVSALEKELITLVIWMVTAFIFAWTPYAIVSFVTVFDSFIIPPLAATFPAIFAKAAVCHFPIIYGFKHAAVKKAFLRIIAVTKGNRITATSGSGMETFPT